MKEIFQEVQDCFMDLGVLLSGFDLENELDRAEIEAIHFALQQTSKVFDAGLCEKAYMCDKCIKNKDQLKALVKMMKECAYTGKMDEVANVALVEFMYIIPQVLSELRAVYLEYYQKTKAKIVIKPTFTPS